MRRRISWLVLGTTSTIVVAFVIPLCLLVRTLAEDRAMADADQEARSVAILVASDVGTDVLRSTVSRLGDAETSVVLPSGKVVGPPLATTDPEVRRARGEAFTVVDGDGGRVYIPVTGADGETTVVRTSVPPETLRQGVVEAWLGIIALGLVLLGIAAVIAAWFGRRISEPLLEVAGTAHRLREGDLAARAEVTGTEETEELARALNGLAERTGELLAQERAAVADLSHRLRTPVTALRLDAEQVDDPEVAARLGQHIGVLQRSIDAIVREARRPVRTALAASCDATEVVGGRIAFWAALADDQQRPLEVSLPEEPVTVPVAPDDLADLLDVLLDNVFAHTPEPVGFRVRLVRLDGVAHLSVTDDGPGPTPHGGGRRTGSTGLGLDIARRTAEGCGGSLDVVAGPGGRGTVVEVLLPVARV
ncbi:sensor histidine kinase [Nocardioides taihuensis]|uniref:Signal transduction histidine-protein kinase/phosphatase MprB n=1 Tax=Nocardioides taihuensis TaxID=1835606 RepID=A0ABW0BL90_9ACTN